MFILFICLGVGLYSFPFERLSAVTFVSDSGNEVESRKLTFSMQLSVSHSISKKIRLVYCLKSIILKEKHGS